MAQDVSSSGAGDMTSALSDFEVAQAMTDGPADQKEKAWGNTDWPQWYGHFKDVPEYNTVVTTKALWIVGTGFTADAETTEHLNKFRGIGIDNFNSLLRNAIMNYQVGGDSFDEIIRDDGVFKKLFTWFGILNPGKPVNLKPLDPGAMMIITNAQGMIIRYEQISKVAGKKNKRYSPEKIFHLARNRFADNVHGTSLTEKLIPKLLAYNESIADYKQVQHRFVKPRWMIKLNTDNQTKINAEKAKWDKANEDGENMYMPMGSVEAEQMSIAEGSTLDPVKWQGSLKDSFYEEGGVPRVIVGNAGGVAEAGVKIVHLGYELVIKSEQQFVEENVLSQLGFKIKLPKPPSLEQDVKKTESKEGSPIKPSDTTASMPGNK